MNHIRRFSFLLLSCACVSCTPDKPSQASVTAQAKPDPRLGKAVLALELIPKEASGKTLEKIRQAPEVFLSLLTELSHSGDEYVLRLVDKKHGLATEYVPPDLVSLNDYGALSVTRNDLSLRKIVMPSLLAMVSSAKAEGITLVFASSYRSWAYQKTVYERNVEQLGKVEASRVSAQPGQSQHQLGTAIDMNPIDDAFANTPAGSWMSQNAWKFGFSLSYPQGMEAQTGYVWESWHFRYLGQAAIRLQREYFQDVQQYFLEFWSAYSRNTLP